MCNINLLIYIELWIHSIVFRPFFFIAVSREGTPCESLVQMTARFDKQRSMLDPNMAGPDRMVSDLTSARMVKGMESKIQMSPDARYETLRIGHTTYQSFGRFIH